MSTHSIRRRAIRDDQKELRRQAILDAARLLFADHPYETLTMADIAHASHLAKGTLFLYFKTKEELFLALLEQELLAWFREVDARLESLRTSGGVEAVAAVICNTLEARPGLTRLLAILHTILERNIDLDTALHFKAFLLEHFTHTGALLEQCLPFLAPGEGAHLLLQGHALVIGLWHLSDPAPVVKQALQQPALRLFEVHFAPEFSLALRALLTGLAQTKQQHTKGE